MTEAFDKAEPSLGGVIDAFASALSQTLAENGRIIPALLAGGRSVDVPEQGLRTSRVCSRGFSTPWRLIGSRSATRILSRR